MKTNIGTDVSKILTNSGAEAKKIYDNKGNIIYNTVTPGFVMQYQTASGGYYEHFDNLSDLKSFLSTNSDVFIGNMKVSGKDITDTDMSYMFAFCQATTIDLSSFDTSNVTDMYNMFYKCQATTIDLSSFDTSNVTDMRCMFDKCQATALDLSSFDTSNITDMSYMFASCQATTGYARTQAEANGFNTSLGKPAGLTFVVKSI